MTRVDGTVHTFGEFKLEASSRRLWRGEQPVALGQKAVAALARLLQSPGELVEKNELISLLWPDTVVDENNLNQQISALRKALGESAEQPRHIVTVPGRGYRFVLAPSNGVSAGPQPDGTPDSAPTPAEPLAASGATRGISGDRAVPPSRRQMVTLSVAAAVLAVSLGAGGMALWQNRNAAASAGTTTILAVLPLKSMGNAVEDGQFGLGIADAIIRNLTAFDGVLVRPTGAVRQYAGTSVGPLEAGRRLEVDTVLDGTVQRDGNRLRVSVQLVRVENGASVWTEHFDTEWRDIFSVQDEIARQVARALALRLKRVPAVRAAERRPTADPEAYASYLKSRYFWNKRTVEGYLRGIGHAEAAADRDPAFAQAYAAIADSYALLGSSPNATIDRGDAMNRARQAAERALSLDPSLAEATTSLAFVKMHYDWNWVEAGRLFARALELDPAYATAHHWYAYYLTARRRDDEAIAHIRRARELDPLSVIIATDVGELLLYAGRVDEAVAAAGVALELDPGFVLAHRVLAWADMRRGDFAGALQRLQGLPTISGTDAGGLRSTVGHLYGRLGQVPSAEHVISSLKGQPAAGSELAIELSVVNAGLGRTDEAFFWLEKSFEARSGSLILLLVEPLWAPLRSDARFAALARRVGLPETN